MTNQPTTDHRPPNTWKSFGPAIRFLSIFVGVYIVLSLLYGVWIHSLGKIADPMTEWVSHQTAWIKGATGSVCTAELNPSGPTVFLKDEVGKTVLNVFEGCNGLNVMIVFLAFVLAFGGPRRRMAWFIPAGLLIIHIANLKRLLFLYYLAETKSHYFYYFHKYFFTAVIYLIVFVLWWVWVRYLQENKPTVDTNAT